MNKNMLNSAWACEPVDYMIRRNIDNSSILRSDSIFRVFSSSPNHDYHRFLDAEVLTVEEDNINLRKYFVEGVI